MIRGLYTDVHVPSALVANLRKAGIDVLTSQVDGTRRLSDSELVERATALDRIVLTWDKDYLEIAATRQANRESFAGIIFITNRRTTIRQLTNDIEMVLACSDESELRDRVAYVPFR